eukprot:597438-Pleurochrysis_carterae.AAC.1
MMSVETRPRSAGRDWYEGGLRTAAGLLGCGCGSHRLKCWGVVRPRGRGMAKSRVPGRLTVEGGRGLRLGYGEETEFTGSSVLEWDDGPRRKES